MIEPNLNHVGIVVPDLEAAMESLGKNLGVSWAGVYDPVMQMHDDKRGTHEVRLHIGITKQTPFLELIQAIPDSPWALDSDLILLHHIAYFADDLAADSGAVAGPCPIEIIGVGEAGDMPRTFTYHVHEGLRFELLERRGV